MQTLSDSQLLPSLAASTLIITGRHAWHDLWAHYTAQAHPSDTWQPEVWDKPMPMKQVRELQAFAGQGAVGAGRFLAVPCADGLARETSNALLKLLEEPGPGVHMVLFAESDKVLPTVRSRVRVITLTDTLSQNRLRQFYENLDPVTQPALTKRFLYYAPLLHGTLQEDVVLDAFPL